MVVYRTLNEKKMNKNEGHGNEKRLRKTLVGWNVCTSGIVKAIDMTENIADRGGLDNISGDKISTRWLKLTKQR